jgi:predicted DsbA family dithiol-disulfide isomerase
MDIQPTYEEQASAQGTNKTVWWVVGAGCALALCFCLILSGLGIYSVYNSSALTGFGPPTATSQPITSVDYHTHFRPNGAALGDPNAPVKVEIYSDFQCPYCKFFWRDTEELIFKNYVATGKVYFTYRSMGVFIGNESAKAAEAAYCAGDQEKFWEYHDLLFANQGAENSGAFSDVNLTGFAQKLNLDMTAFNTCFSGGKYAERVKKDREDATAAGVKATPTFLINGTIIEGSQPYENFKNVIDDALIGGG